MKKLIQYTVLWAMTLMLSFSLHASTSSRASDTESAKALKELTLMLEWFVNPDHGPIIIARENGYFEDLGLKVNIQEPADPNLPPKLVAAEQVDLAVYYQPSLTHAVANGLPLIWAGTLVGTPLDGLLVLEDGPIKSLNDMKGKTIGLNIGGIENAFLNTLFAPYGFGAGDVKLVNVGWNLSSSLMSGRVDAIMGAYRNFELNQLAIEGHKGRMFYYEENNIPPYDELIFIANSKKHDKDAIRRFLRAIELGTQYIVNNPEKSWAIFRDYSPKKLDNELNRRAWFATISRFDLRPAAKDTGRYQAFADYLQEHGELEETVNAVDFMITF
ncbi:ABC transporter substrate-binding protein [Endozoicomonas sp. SCSIO W0465]|uniref:ABC transporter substrate-binding protein n=1 Tax=Endozoicomonas sp. SCSIO W0465 TaxID=2918516 RepID=UPI002075804B|nr:ABC transporter substrate-binding protein [Endozoicomonas sp. SCSIO W0465]USE37186.1 ABC transporter substrate-binding protein [Endozoicomonas sp. SCSIO W0465]